MDCRERHKNEKDSTLSFTGKFTSGGASEYSGSNAWNYNHANGNMNVNNKNNTLTVRPSAEFQDMSGMVLYQSLLEAYIVCRENKRSAFSTIEFEVNYISELVQLWRAVRDRVYRPSRSIAFLVYKPRVREIFAAEFVDRIVHHYLDMRLRPLIEEDLLDSVYNNRVGKGTAAAVKGLEVAVKECSKNYTKGCYICLMDLRGFFMSIPRLRVRDDIIAYTRERYKGYDIEIAVFLLDVVLSNKPEKNCILKTPWREWEKVPESKSMFFGKEDNGLTLGDLISQLLVNFFLNALDHFIVGVLGFKFYGRYVDDFGIVHESKEAILEAIPKIREFLEGLGVTLHPDKFYIQHYTKGGEFIGAVIKPGRVYIHNRTVNNAYLAIRKLNRLNPDSIDDRERFRAIVNSYLGFMKNKATYNIRRKLISEIDPGWWKYFYIGGSHEKVVLMKKHERSRITRGKLVRQKKLNKIERRQYHVPA